MEHSRHTTDLDHDLVDVALRTVRERARGDNHTVAAAGRGRDGRVVVAMNAYHFTGGPCAELALLGAAAAQGIYELRTVVAAGDRDRGVIAPCGRCRQALLDYFPEVEVILGNGGRRRSVPVRSLLPESYVWAEHQLDTDGD